MISQTMLLVYLTVLVGVDVTQSVLITMLRIEVAKLRGRVAK